MSAGFKTGGFLLALAAGLCSHGVMAADWAPSDRITLVSQSSPGTGNELMLRELADIWNKNKMIPKLAAVENVTGSQGEKMRRYVIFQNKGNAHMLAAYTPSTLNSALQNRRETSRPPCDLRDGCCGQGSSSETGQLELRDSREE